jgi:hypothetical protein
MSITDPLVPFCLGFESKAFKDTLARDISQLFLLLVHFFEDEGFFLAI